MNPFFPSIILFLLTTQALGDPCDNPNGFEVHSGPTTNITCCENREITLKNLTIETFDMEKVTELHINSCHLSQDLTILQFLSELGLTNTSVNVLNISKPKFLTSRQLKGMTKSGVTEMTVEILDETGHDLFSSMSELIKLNIKVPSIQLLPDLTYLKNLEALNIEFTKHEEYWNDSLFRQFLPIVLQNTSHFKSLSINGPAFLDDLYQILTDDSFVNQSQMELIRLESLGITEIPSNAFINMSNLTNVSLEMNHLKVFDMQFLPSSLQILNIAYNELEEFHFSKPFPHLRELNLETNLIKSFILDLNFTLKGLQKLCLTDNFLTVLEIIPHPSHQLTELDLSKNEIRDANVWFWSYLNRNRTRINLDGNYPACDCATRDRLLAMNKSDADEKRVSRPFVKYCTPFPIFEIRILLNEFNCSTTSNGKCIINHSYLSDVDPDILGEPEWQAATIYNCTISDNHVVELEPDLIDHVFIIFTGNSKITSIGNIDHIKDTMVHVYAEGCNIRSLSLENLPQKLRNLHLAGNDIRVIDVQVLERLKTMNTYITLRGNPLSCDCERQEMFKALIDMKHLIDDWDEVRCDDGGLFDPDRELCVSWETILLSFGVVILAIITCLVGFYLRYTLEVQVYIYSRGWLPAVFRPEPDDQDYEYDVFVSYSDKDEEFVVFLLDFLENHVQPSFKVCHHHRDWIPGQRIDRQIITSIESSRKTIVILSRNFLASYWSNMEFRTAHYTMLQEKAPRLIMIIYGEIGPVSELEPEFRSYIKTTTYLASDDRWFKKKITFALRKADVVYKIVENVITTPPQ